MREDHQREDISGKFGSVEIVNGKILPLLKAFVQLPSICQITVIPVASGTKRMSTKDNAMQIPLNFKIFRLRKRNKMLRLSWYSISVKRFFNNLKLKIS